MLTISSYIRTPLTIPLQITLSDFELSGFVILVFSKQKGITVVFRNDPLESLKVSSTFDSIPFVRNFLQKAIETQLRTLFMDELPAIIHRLSLRLWVPEYRVDEEVSKQLSVNGPGQDPLASPPQDPVDSFGNVLSESQIASLSLDSSIETHSLFSQKNLLSLAALTDSQRTLSLFTPSIQEVVYRACTSPSDQGEALGNVVSLNSAALGRTQSNTGSVASFPDTASISSMQSSRPSTLSSHNFCGYGLSLGAGRHKAHARKRKKRVLNLRQPKNSIPETVSVSDDTSFTETTDSPSVYSAPLPTTTLPATLEEQDDPVTPPLSPVSGRHLSSNPGYQLNSFLPMPRRQAPSTEALRGSGEPSISSESGKKTEYLDPTPRNTLRSHSLKSYNNGNNKNNNYAATEKEAGTSSSRSELQHSGLSAFVKDELASEVMDQELLDRLAGKVAHRMREEMVIDGRLWDRSPPPAYDQ